MDGLDLWNPHQDRVLVGPGEAVVPDTQWKDSHLQKSCSRRHGGYRRLFAGKLFIEITQSSVPFCDTDNKMMLHNKPKRDFPSRRTSRRLRRARTRGRRSRTASGCRPRRRARGTETQTFLKRMNTYFESTKICPGNNKGRVPTTKWRGQRGQKRRDRAAQNWKKKRDQRKSEERQEDFQEPFQSWQNSEFSPQFPFANLLPHFFSWRYVGYLDGDGRKKLRHCQVSLPSIAISETQKKVKIWGGKQT